MRHELSEKQNLFFCSGNTKSRLSLITIFTIFAVIISASISRSRDFDPKALYLTWQYDPTTSMTIDWHTLPQHEDYHVQSILQFKKTGADEWREVNGAYHKFPHSDRHIHRVTLRHLEPGTTYRFRFGYNTESYRFETMPEDLSEPLRFAAGGDSDHGEDFQKMNRVVMEYDVDFILLGGDIAYDDGDPIRKPRLYGWLEGVKETLIDEDGLVTPIVVAIGNHELFGVRRPLRGSGPHDPMTEEEAQAYMDEHNLWDGKPTYFFHLFAFPGRPSYNVLDFADYMSILALDSNHYSDVAGSQTSWLEAKLSERQNRTHVFPIYHVPAYPSYRSYTGSTSTEIREHWVPLFEEYGIRAAFENHDHTYKRTYPLLDGEIVDDGEGIVYLGDGAWAQTKDAEDSESYEEWHWYLREYLAEVEHAIITTVHEDGTQEFVMVSNEGKIIDSYQINP